MTKQKRYRKIGPMILVLLAAWMLTVTSCLDETLVSVTYGSGAEAPEAEDADMYLSINVPRTSFAATPAGKENAIETLDVLVCRPGVGSDAGKFFVYAACKGTLVPDPSSKPSNIFQVIMPVGKNLTVHVFANCHDALVAKDFYNSRGREMNAMLRTLTFGANPNTSETLPMHGFVKGVTVDKTMINAKLDVQMLRSVAAVQVMTKVKEDFTTGTLVGEDGQPNFQMHSLYAYFYADSAQIAAHDPEAYSEKVPADGDITRDVVKESLPPYHKVSDTYENQADHPGMPLPYSIISADATSSLATIYLYENSPWSETGFDYPDEKNPAATTRLVVGGVYKDDKNDDDTPKITYYRVDFPDATDNTKLTSILRNHKYTFSIEKVSGSGYDTPDDAARGVPINIYVNLIDWTNVLEHVDFDRQNYFYSEAKTISLPRDKDAVRSITVKSDVTIDQWQMSFKDGTNGPATLSGTGNTILSNNRYRVEKKDDALIFTALKAYNVLDTGESLTETFIIKAKELQITYTITQADSSPDDWGNGGGTNTDLGITPIDIGLDFVIAPGNVIATEVGTEADGVTKKYKYSFAQAQNATGNYFSWNTLGLAESSSNNTWSDDRDVCRKVGARWYTPTRNQLQALINSGTCYGWWDSVNGYYFGTTTVPVKSEQERYVFLPYTKSKQHGGGYYSNTLYWSSNHSWGNVAAAIEFKSSEIHVGNFEINASTNIRCVADKYEK